MTYPPDLKFSEPSLLVFILPQINPSSSCIKKTYFQDYKLYDPIRFPHTYITFFLTTYLHNFPSHHTYTSTDSDHLETVFYENTIGLNRSLYSMKHVLIKRKLTYHLWFDKQFLTFKRDMRHYERVWLKTRLDRCWYCFTVQPYTVSLKIAKNNSETIVPQSLPVDPVGCP